jgi:hypothetical protein
VKSLPHRFWWVFAGAALALALAADLTAAKAAPPPKGKWTWTESYAERTLLKKLRIPCRNARGRSSDCDVAEAQAKVDEWN